MYILVFHHQHFNKLFSLISISSHHIIIWVIYFFIKHYMKVYWVHTHVIWTNYELDDNFLTTLKIHNKLNTKNFAIKFWDCVWCMNSLSTRIFFHHLHIKIRINTLTIFKLYSMMSKVPHFKICFHLTSAIDQNATNAIFTCLLVAHLVACSSTIKRYVIMLILFSSFHFTF
jgi:hypothetical protein